MLIDQRKPSANIETSSAWPSLSLSVKTLIWSVLGPGYSGLGRCVLDSMTKTRPWGSTATPVGVQICGCSAKSVIWKRGSSIWREGEPAKAGTTYRADATRRVRAVALMRLGKELFHNLAVNVRQAKIAAL